MGIEPNIISPRSSESEDWGGGGGGGGGRGGRGREGRGGVMKKHPQSKSYNVDVLVTHINVLP